MTKTVILLGPTAAGKSQLAIELAKEINGEIISADSMQVYRGMDIGTAKLAPAERRGIPHHLIDIRDPDESWTVSDFVGETDKLINQRTKEQKNCIIVGGTGLYLWSLLEGFAFPIAETDAELRKALAKLSASALHNQLFKLDPQAAHRINPNDQKRVIRALEVYELTGKPISELQKNRQASPHLSVGNNKNILIGLTAPRDQLYARINQRVGRMIEQGLIAEVKGLLTKGYAQDLKSFQALGYKEVIEHLAGKWTQEQMSEELKKRTRHFARRQLTWFRRFKNVRWFAPPVDIPAVLSYISSV